MATLFFQLSPLILLIIPFTQSISKFSQNIPNIHPMSTATTWSKTPSCLPWIPSDAPLDFYFNLVILYVTLNTTAPVIHFNTYWTLFPHGWNLPGLPLSSAQNPKSSHTRSPRAGAPAPLRPRHPPLSCSHCPFQAHWLLADPETQPPPSQLKSLLSICSLGLGRPSEKYPHGFAPPFSQSLLKHQTMRVVFLGHPE